MSAPAWHHDSAVVNWLIERAQAAYSSAVVDVDTLAAYAGAPLADYASVTACRLRLADVYAAHMVAWGQALDSAFTWSEIEEIPFNEEGLVCI